MYTSSVLPEAITSVPIVAPFTMVIVPWLVTIVVMPCEGLFRVAVKV